MHSKNVNIYQCEIEKFSATYLKDLDFCHMVAANFVADAYGFHIANAGLEVQRREQLKELHV